MTTKRDPWVQVKSEDELRAGMAVQLRPCVWCGRIETFVLTRDGGTYTGFAAGHDGRHYRENARIFTSAGRCRNSVEEWLPSRMVREGRLFRLADDQLADLSETRELETVR